MCKNFAGFIAGAFILSITGLGSRIAVIDELHGAHASSVCPGCEGIFWIAAFALPLLVGLFIGAFGGSWHCAGMAAIVALITRNLAAGPGWQQTVHTPVLAILSLLYVALAIAGGFIGSRLTSRRYCFARARRQYSPKASAPTHDSDQGQYHNHDNMAF